jgi:hypothetical protein
MPRSFVPAAIALVFAIAAPASHPARAEAFNTCTGFVSSLPATITTPGVWCLRGDLSTAIVSGAAITIAVNNVTLDCNGFRIGGLAAGNPSNALGVAARDRQNATVRNCGIRGFRTGIALNQGAGHLVADNRLDSNLYAAIEVLATHSVVERNRIYDTGGLAGSNHAVAIDADAHILHNTIAGLFADASGGHVAAIRVGGTGFRVQGNSISEMQVMRSQGTATSGAYGMVVLGDYTLVSGNHLTGAGSGSVGIEVWGVQNFCHDNFFGRFEDDISDACHESGNASVR